MSAEFYTQDGFAIESRVFHGFFTRRGGVSEGVYESLNVGYGSGDERAHIDENRRRVAEVARVEADHVLTVYQEHGKTCLPVHEPHDVKNAPKADAMVTDKAGLALGVMSADCAPVLFYAPGEKPVIGAAHAGWRGALGGVLGSTVEQMVKLGAAVETIEACIGPCIGRVAYEVSEGFVEPFMEEDEENERFFSAGTRAANLQFDLAGYCAFKLSKAGLRKVFIRDLDTYGLEQDFFSYRRTTHRGEPDYGRQISMIALKV